MGIAQTLHRVRWWRVTGTVAVLGALLIAWAWWRTRVRPEWWHEVVANAQTDQAAEHIENGLVSELTMARPAAADADAAHYHSTSWTYIIKDEEADAWLSTRLKGWLTNRNLKWPPGVDNVQVDLRDGEVVLGARVVSKGTERVLSASVSPQVRPDGSLWIKLNGMFVGGLPLPSGIVLSELRDAAKDMPTTQQWIDTLEGKKPLLPDAGIKLEDGRMVRLQKVVAKKGAIEVTCRTETAAHN